MNLLITGSSGFVGSNFVKNSKDFNITEIDLLVKKVEELDCTAIDTVLHLAALVHQMKGAPEDQYLKINRDLALEVAIVAKKQGVKQFVFMSTVKVFGESTTEETSWNESSKCNPEDAYGRSKFEAEKLLLELQDENFNVAIIRSPLVYGPGVKANMFNLISLIDKFPILPLGGINNKRTMVYIGNLIALIQHIINKRASGIFIAGDTGSISTTSLVKMIAESLNKKVILIKIPKLIIFALSKLKPNSFRRLFGSFEIDNSKTNQILNFVPPFTKEEGISEMVEWYRNTFQITNKI